MSKWSLLGAVFVYGAHHFGVRSCTFSTIFIASANSTKWTISFSKFTAFQRGCDDSNEREVTRDTINISYTL